MSELPPFPPSDAWAIRRAASGNTWAEGKPSAVAQVMCLALEKHPGFDQIAQWFKDSPAALTQIMAVDPQTPPPATALQSIKTMSQVEVFVPTLPAYARCEVPKSTPRKSFVDEVAAWAGMVSPMTPRMFLESGALWLVGLAVARRACWHIHKPIFPQYYLIWVAPTSRYKKTTGANAIRALGMQAVPELFLPEEIGSPEAFLSSLGGKRPSNYETLKQYHKDMIEKSIPHAAQRGLNLDEISSLLGANKKDHMQGLEEMILRGFDAPALYRRLTQSEGFTAIHNMHLSILGQTTPAALARNLRPGDWETGLMARFVALAPEGKIDYKLPELSPQELQPPSALVAQLRTLFHALPEPPSELEPSQDMPARQMITVFAEKDALRAFDAYTRAVTFDLLEDGSNAPDGRLHGNYSRLHEYAAKNALVFALCEWAANGAQGIPRITLLHWARGQEIAEGWRASWHQLLRQLDNNQELKDMEKIIGLLGRNNEKGMTKREITQYASLSYKAVSDALQVLVEAEDVSIGHREGKQKAIIYRLAGWVGA